MLRKVDEPAYLGFAVHTGWAAAVAITGSVKSPRVVGRRRLVLLDGGIARAQVYHAAAKLPECGRKALVAQVTREARVRASDEVVGLDIELRTAGYRARAGGLVIGATRVPTALNKILASHAMIHTAEGALYRSALAEGVRSCGLAVTEVPARELSGRLDQLLHLDDAERRLRGAEAGHGMGAPWAKDQKEAYLIAWLVMATLDARSGRRARLGGQP